MIKEIYSENKFIEAIENKKTDNVAYKFNEKTRTVSIISTQSSDWIISKIKYHIIRIFWGYHSVDLAVQRELVQKKVTHLFDLEDMAESTGKIAELLNRSELLNETEKKPTETESALNPSLTRTQQEVEKQCTSQEISAKSPAQMLTEAKSIIEQVCDLRAIIQDLEKKQQGLEKLTSDLEKDFSAKSEQLWNQVEHFLIDSNPEIYTQLLRHRLEYLKGQLPNIAESYSSLDVAENGCMRRTLKDYIKTISSIREELKSGIKSSEQRINALVKLEFLELFPDIRSFEERKLVVSLFKELIDCNYRLHRVNDRISGTCSNL